MEKLEFFIPPKSEDYLKMEQIWSSTHESDTYLRSYLSIRS